MLQQRHRLRVLLLVFVLLALLCAFWKIANQPPPAVFAPAPGFVVPPLSDRRPGAELSPDGRFRFDANFVSAAPGQAVHAATLVELKNGDLRAVWFSGSREGAGDVTVQTAVMNIRTQRWSQETSLFDTHHVQRSLMRYVKKLGNPVIGRAPDGNLMLWMVNVSLGGWAGSAISFARSQDEGITWSVPQRLVTSPFLNISTLVKSPPVSLANGNMLLPVYHEFVTKFSEVLQLDATGQIFDKVRVPGSQTSLQPVVMVSSVTNAQMYMRSSASNALVQSASFDGGANWSKSRIGALPNPDAAVAGVVTRTLNTQPRQWLALNPTTNNREQLALISAPLGGSFEGAMPWMVESTRSPDARLDIADYERLLSDELKQRGATEKQAQAYAASARRQLCGASHCAQEFSYPFLLQTRDGDLHLVYTWHRTRIKHIRLNLLQISMPQGAKQ